MVGGNHQLSAGQPTVNGLRLSAGTETNGNLQMLLVMCSHQLSNPGQPIAIADWKWAQSLSALKTSHYW